jgi:isopentenyl-diphosphate delta-isomerase
VTVNDSEVADCFYIAPEALDRELQENPTRYTPWLKLEWPLIREKFWSQVEAL